MSGKALCCLLATCLRDLYHIENAHTRRLPTISLHLKTVYIYISINIRVYVTLNHDTLWRLWVVIIITPFWCIPHISTSMSFSFNEKREVIAIFILYKPHIVDKKIWTRCKAQLDFVMMLTINVRIALILRIFFIEIKNDKLYKKFAVRLVLCNVVVIYLY